MVRLKQSVKSLYPLPYVFFSWLRRFGCSDPHQNFGLHSTNLRSFRCSPPQGKVKKTRKFAEVKRMLNPNDARLKANQKKAEEKQKKAKEAEVRHAPQTASSMFFRYNAALGPPYQVLVDTNFINFAISNKIDLEKGMLDCLFAKSEQQVAEEQTGDPWKLYEAANYPHLASCVACLLPEVADFGCFDSKHSLCSISNPLSFNSHSNDLHHGLCYSRTRKTRTQIPHRLANGPRPTLRAHAVFAQRYLCR